MPRPDELDHGWTKRSGAPDYDDRRAFQTESCPEPVTGPGPIPWLIFGIIIGAVGWWFMAPFLMSGFGSDVNGCDQYRTEMVACAETR